jgi:microcystin-dependent protein
MDFDHIPNHFDIKIGNIITNHPSGKTNCYVRFENIPGYWDNSFIVPIEKQPMIMRGDKVGIGKEPEAKLDIGGNNPKEIQAIFTRSIDKKSQLVAQNGSPSEAAGTLLARFGMVQQGKSDLNKQWKAGLRFQNQKGEAENDVGLTIDTNGQERIRIHADGLVEILEKLRALGNLSVIKNLVVGLDAEISGNIKSFQRIKDKTGDVMPVGAIIAYGGAELPEGWLICDGSSILGNDTYSELKLKLAKNTVPDLRSRFIVGAGKGPGLRNYPKGLGADVGKEKHTLLISEMPSHHHKIHTGSGSGSTYNDRVDAWDNKGTRTLRDKEIIDKTGSDQPHNNLPPYYALTYIIKY